MKNVNKEIWQKLLEAKKCAFLVHKNPDLDTLGSAISLHSALLSLQKESYLVAPKLPIATKYHFMPFVDKFIDKIPKDTDLLVALDSADTKLLLPDLPNLQIIAIDHHKTNTNYADITLLDSDAASTGEVVAQMLFEVGAKINAKTASALYASIISDTKQFATPRVNSSTFEIASRLISFGANPTDLALKVTQNKPLSQVRIEGYALANAQLFANGSVFVAIITSEIRKKTGATLADTSEICYELLGATTVKVAVLLVEIEAGLIKGSLRAKAGVDVDLSAIARAFDGGGHEKSAGFVARGTLDEMLNNILKMLQSSDLNN